MSERILPPGWVRPTLGEVARINFRDPVLHDLPDDLPVTFLPMAAVDADSGTIVTPQERSLTEVRKGYTPFSEDDVLFAKITPSMENGKAAIARGLKNGRGFGSTEFHVFSPQPGILSEWIFYFIRQSSFRSDAKANFAGTAGQLRVPKSFLEGYHIPLPPLPEQHRIVAEIEKQLTRLDAGVAALRRAQTNLQRYKAAVLKAACEGRLVPQDPADEPASALLERILAERRQRWEAEQIARGKDPKKRKYKEPALPDMSGLLELPEGWVWATVEQVCERIVDCLHSTPKFTESGFFCIDTNCIKPGQIVFEKIRYVDEATFIDRNRRMKPRENDILFSREGALLGIAVRVPANLEFCLGQRMMIFRLSRCVDAQYYESVLNSVVFRSQYVTEITGSASPHLNIGDIRRLGIPLPPPAEQQRIVTEVERRLSVVEELEAAVEANLKRAERLRQAVLKRAFEGKLVPQNPNDEPASLLLERIRAAREEPEAGGKSNRRSSRRQKRGRGKVSDKQLRLL
jgi:type I restriction enzyme S subunit